MIRYHDPVDIDFGGDCVLKKMKFTNPQEQQAAILELNLMNAVNDISKGTQYFA